MGLADPAQGSTSVRYAILGKLATGGMAELFLARASSLGGVERHVVLKRVLPSRLVDPQFATMFLDEARLAAQLHHHNIAQVHDIGRLGESYFFTMEYVHGEDVRAMLARLAALGRKLPISHTLHIAAGVAAGLDYAHARTRSDGRPLNIVHRDVTPANVMVSFEGAVKLVDFGVAKAAHRSIETQAGAVKGKVAYLSPEQCRGRPVDRRSDVFSLGILLYEMLTGARLFRRDSDYDTMQAIVGEDVPPPSRQRPEVTPSLDRIVMTALAKDPRARYQAAGEMLESIEAVASRDGWTMSPAGVGRFLRELFGDRPEPWIDLGRRRDAPRPITVTGASVQLPRGVDTSEMLALDDPAVEAQLEKTVQLRPASAADELPPPVDPAATDESYATLEDEPDAGATVPQGRRARRDSGPTDRPGGQVGRTTGSTKSLAPLPPGDAAARRTAMGLAPVTEARAPLRRAPTTRPDLETPARRDSSPRLDGARQTQPGRALGEPAGAAPAPPPPPLPATASPPPPPIPSAAGKPTAPGRAVTLPPARPVLGAAATSEPRERSRETGPGIEVAPIVHDSVPPATRPAPAGPAPADPAVDAPARRKRPSDVAYQLMQGPSMRAFEDAVAAEDSDELSFLDDDAVVTRAQPRAKSPRPDSTTTSAAAELVDPALDDLIAAASGRRTRRLYVMIGAAAAAIVVLVIALRVATRDRARSAPPEAATTPAAAAALAPAPAPAPAAPAPRAVEPAADEPAVDEPAVEQPPPYVPPAPAHLPAIDPPVAGAVKDPPPPPPRAVEPPADRTPDAGARHRARKPAGRNAERVALEQIRTAVAARAWGDALSSCKSAPRRALTAQVRGACALAACSARREPEAKKYAGGLPERRKTAIRQSCLSRGVSID